ncbi:MAG: AAA family ATPase [Myxococcota bacterium]
MSNHEEPHAFAGQVASDRLTFSLDDALAILKRRYLWLLLGLTVGLGLGVAALQFVSPSYTAKTAVLVRPAEMSKEFVRGAVIEPIRDRLQTMNERLLSHDHLVQTIDSVGIDRVDPEGKLGLMGAVDHLRRKIDVEVGNSESPYAGVFRVAYSAKDPEVAADVVRTLVEVFNTEGIRERVEKATATVDFLDHELASLGQKLAETEAELPAEATLTPTRTGRDPVRVELATLNAELSELLAQFTELHPEVNRKRREIARARRRLVARPSQNAAAAGSGADGETATVPRDYKRLVESYELLVARRVEAAIARDLAQTTVQGDYRIIEPAVAPGRPSRPDPMMFSAGGALAGLFAAIALAGLWEIRTRPFHSQGTLETRSGIPVLASVPGIKPRPATLGTESAYADSVDARVVAAHDPSGIAAEQFRRLGAHLVDDRKSVVVAVTSALSGDGKSLTAANLAASIALELGKRVLLVDADLHRPDIHEFYKVPSGLGLLDLLRSSGKKGGLVQQTEIPNLSVLVAGSAGRDSLRYFVSSAWGGFVEGARETFDAVIIDCAPLLATVDSRFVARSADKRILTVRRGQTSGEATIKAISELGSLEGIVFNDVEKRTLRNYYYYSERNFENQSD